MPPPPVISLSDMSKGLISGGQLYDAMGFDDYDADDQPNCAVLYYPQKEIGSTQMGHYTALSMPPDEENLHYFDSYGHKPDAVEKMARDEGEDLYEGDQTELLKQVLTYGGELGLDWNETKYQSREDPRIATCGLWALDRCFHGDLTNKQYKDVWDYRLKMPEFRSLTPDEVVVQRWSPEA